MCHQITDVTVRPFLHLLHPTRKSRRELQIPGRDVSDPRWPSSVERFCSVTRLPVRCVFRSCVLEPRRSKQSAPACWQKLYFAQLFGRSKRLCVTDPRVQGVQRSQGFRPHSVSGSPANRCGSVPLAHPMAGPLCRVRRRGGDSFRRHRPPSS
jgi:hypothetical protein